MVHRKSAYQTGFKRIEWPKAHAMEMFAKQIFRTSSTERFGIRFNAWPPFSWFSWHFFKDYPHSFLTESHHWWGEKNHTNHRKLRLRNGLSRPDNLRDTIPAAEEECNLLRSCTFGFSLSCSCEYFQPMTSHRVQRYTYFGSQVTNVFWKSL